MFDISQAESVELKACTLSIHNPSEQQGAYHSDVAFFRAKETPQAATAGEPAIRRHPEIALADCVARGEACLLRTEGLQPAELSWDNGLLVTSERLLAADGGESTPSADPIVLLKLKHLTAVVRGGLCRFRHSPFATMPLAAQLSCSDSILVGGAESALVEQVGNASLDQFRERIAWTGDHNVYLGFSRFWSIRSLDPNAPVETMDFDAWRARWSSSESNPSVRAEWKRPLPLDRPTSAQVPADYALGDTADNPPRKGASDGRDAGMDLTRIPVPPESGPAEKTAP
jgi:hypothetical protein